MTTSTRLRLAVAACTLLALAACGGGGSSGGQASSAATPPAATAPTGAQSSEVAATAAFKSSARHADDLRPCTYNGSSTSTCTLARLPFLGQEHSDPDLAAVMDRVLVSHAWMGENFEAMLALLPDDLLLLLRSITAIVIAADIRPAHYEAGTGAIYLDPDFLWLTQAQRADITAAPDARLGFGQNLQFSMPWRYVRNGTRLTIGLDADGNRSLQDTAIVLAFLLYHELSHAVDFMPPSRFAGLDSSRTAAAVLNDPASRLSRALFASQPLTSALLFDLAAVSFNGSSATAAQQALLPQDLVDEFAPDGAVQYYSYSTEREDFANLVETALMAFHFGYDKDTAITDKGVTTDSSIVAWGQRGRMSDQAVLARTLAAVQAAYPGDLAALEAFVSGRQPVAMRVGETWAQNLDLSSAAPGPASAGGRAVSRRVVDDPVSRTAIH